MGSPWTDCGEEFRKQSVAKAGVKVDGGFLDVSSARFWWEAEHFDSSAEARGAFKLAYQQWMDGMGWSPREHRSRREVRATSDQCIRHCLRPKATEHRSPHPMDTRILDETEVSPTQSNGASIAT